MILSFLPGGHFKTSDYWGGGGASGLHRFNESPANASSGANGGKGGGGGGGGLYLDLSNTGDVNGINPANNGSSQDGGNGGENTGGGGGGGEWSSGQGGAGGSGIVIIRWKKLMTYEYVKNANVTDLFTNNMIAHYTFDNVLTDSSGNENHSIDFNTPIFSSILNPRGSHCIQFNGGAYDDLLYILY